MSDNAFEIFESFAVFCWCSLCLWSTTSCSWNICVFCVLSLEKLRIVIKIHSPGQNLLFLCHEPMSTTVWVLLIICFFKKLIFCVCFWTSWVIWIWAANPYLIVYLPALLLKVQASGGVPVLWEIMYVLDSLLWRGLGFLFYPLCIWSHEYLDSSLSGLINAFKEKATSVFLLHLRVSTFTWILHW